MPNKSRDSFFRILPMAILLAAFPISGRSQSTPQSAQSGAYKSDAGNFSAAFPGDPKDTDTSEPKGPSTHTIQSIAGSNSFMVVYVISESAQTVDETNFKEYRDAFIKSLGSCSVANEAAASPSIAGFVGHSYHLSCTFSNVNLTLAGNLYWGKHYSYAVLAVFQPVATDPPAAISFLNSFSVTDTNK